MTKASRIRPPARPPAAARAAGWRWPTWLVAGYTLAAFSWSMPEGLFPPKPYVDTLTAGPMLALGLWQQWSMFAPDPRDQDICVEVACIDATGNRERRMLTDMVAMGYLERWQKERWRKFFNDHLRLDDEKHLWQPFAEYALRCLQDDGLDPVTVDLVRWWRPCAPEIGPDQRADVRVTPWNGYTFHRWRVPPDRRLDAVRGGLP
jgi:hypothetical protein